MSTRKSFF